MCVRQTNKISSIIDMYRVKPFPSLQSKIYAELGEWSKCRYDHWSKIMQRRVRDFQIGFSIHSYEFAKDIRKEFNKVLGKIPSSFRRGLAMIFIKTLSNSWCTTEWSHETVRLPCVFGCLDCKDNLSHYLKCEPFWTIIISSLNMHQSWLQCTPAAKLCLTHISPQNLFLMGIAFKTYHALRIDFEDLINKAVAS